jgi:hypothetical protein
MPWRPRRRGFDFRAGTLRQPVVLLRLSRPKEEEEGTMQSRRRLVHGAAVTAAVIAVALLGVAGCSTVGPESSWTGSEGSVTGVVRSTTGSALVGIDVRMCAQSDDGECIEYQTCTGSGGVYSVDGVELGEAHAYEKDYVVYVNRTTSSALPIVSGYGTYVGTVEITSRGSMYDVTITAQGPGVPDGFVE